MFSTASRFVRAHLEFCTPRGQTQWFLLFRRRDLRRPYTVF